MKKIFISTFLAGLVFIAGSGTAIAQDSSKIIPVELWTCSYNEGKGAADLDAFVDRWNAWADERGMDNYSAWTLTPYYYGPGSNAGFDVAWMAAATDAVALGEVQDDWMTNGGALLDEVNSIVSCGGHANYASANFKMPPEGATPADSILTFSDCNVKDGATWPAVNDAMERLSQYLADQGSETGIWHFYPVYGGGGEDFDFKWLEAHTNLAALGADYEIYGNGGGVAVSGQLFGHLLDCDSSRAYMAKNRRFVQLR